MKLRSLLYSYLIFLFLIQQTISAQQDQLNLHSLENILAFGNFLYCEQDYLRAIDEYKKYLSVQNDDSIQFKVAVSYSILGYYKDSETELDKITNSPLSQNIFHFKMKNKFLQNDFAGMRSIYEKYNTKASGLELNYFSYLMDTSVLPEKQIFLNAFTDELKPAIEKYYLRKLYPAYRSPAFAGILSAIVPGAGKIYSGNIGDGITAAILTGLLSFISYDSFRANHNFKGWLFTGITAFFYAGNIYGSVAAAQIHNEEVKFNFRTELDSFIKAKKYFLPDYEIPCN